MTQKEFKKYKLQYSFTADDIEVAKEIISKKVYGNSKINFTLFEEHKNYEYFYFVNYKEETNKKVILCKNGNRYQLRYKLWK
ncbi:MAG: hypothetical protein ACRCX2_09720 [Paraclostridium sp.]